MRLTKEQKENREKFIDRFVVIIVGSEKEFNKLQKELIGSGLKARNIDIKKREVSFVEDGVMSYKKYKRKNNIPPVFLSIRTGSNTFGWGCNVGEKHGLKNPKQFECYSFSELSKKQLEDIISITNVKKLTLKAKEGGKIKDVEIALDKEGVSFMPADDIMIELTFDDIEKVYKRAMGLEKLKEVKKPASLESENNIENSFDRMKL